MLKLASSWKMIKMCFSLLFIFIMITSQVEAKNSCNDECLTKTYCISSDGTSICSKNNAVTAQFKVIPVFGKYDYLQLSVKSYSLAPDDEKTVQVGIQQPGSISNVYTCYKSSLGSTYARFDRGTYGKIAGSSYYKDRVLYCTWIFNIFDDIWPMGTDMFKDSSQSIALYDDLQKVMVAQNTSQLPIYHAQYLKCCNKVHGNAAFLITFDQTEKQIHYRLNYFERNSDEVTVNLTRKLDGIKLQFKCNLYPKVTIDGYIINGTERFSISQQVTQRAIINDEIITWVTPFVLDASIFSIEASYTVFDLKVEDALGSVYTEEAVTLKNASHLIKLSFIAIAFTVLFQISLSFA